MKITELYRRYSEQALKAAREADDPNTKNQWLSIAEEWTFLAATRLAILSEKEPKSPGLT